MADFTVSLNFLDLTTHEAPRQTDLLFFEQSRGWVTRGWLGEQGELVMIGSGNWQPTHFASLQEALREHGPQVDVFGQPLH